MPQGLLDNSLLLGSLTHLVLGEAANSVSVNVHPFLIAGWCGMVSTALNCLPVGCLDGGRVMLASPPPSQTPPSQTMSNPQFANDAPPCVSRRHLVQAAFGRNLLGLTSFLTYVGLGLGFLGSGLALPFGIFVLLCQRDPEKYLQVSLPAPFSLVHATLTGWFSRLDLLCRIL